MNRGSRPSACTATTGSTRPLKWLSTMITGRSSGTRSRPWTVTSRKNPSTTTPAIAASERSSPALVAPSPRGRRVSAAQAQTTARTAVATCHTPCHWKTASGWQTGDPVRPRRKAPTANTATRTKGRSDQAGRARARMRWTRNATRATTTSTTTTASVASGTGTRTTPMTTSTAPAAIVAQRPAPLAPSRREENRRADEPGPPGRSLATCQPATNPRAPSRLRSCSQRPDASTAAW